MQFTVASKLQQADVAFVEQRSFIDAVQHYGHSHFEQKLRGFLDVMMHFVCVMCV